MCIHFLARSVQSSMPDHDRCLLWLPSIPSVHHANISNGHFNFGTVWIPSTKKLAEHRTINIKRCTKADD